MAAPPFMAVSYTHLMLVYTRMPVREIAMRLSFGDPHYFSNAFKKVVGKSPRDYRQSMGDIQTVSYTHLDVYKRQLLSLCYFLHPLPLEV